MASMDWDIIIVAIIGFLGNAIVSLMANSKTAALMNYRLDILEKKQDKHNSVVERTYALEKDVAKLELEISEMKERK